MTNLKNVCWAVGCIRINFTVLTHTSVSTVFCTGSDSMVSPKQPKQPKQAKQPDNVYVNVYVYENENDNENVYVSESEVVHT